MIQPAQRDRSGFTSGQSALRSSLGRQPGREIQWAWRQTSRAALRPCALLSCPPSRLPPAPPSHLPDGAPPSRAGPSVAARLAAERGRCELRLRTRRGWRLRRRQARRVLGGLPRGAGAADRARRAGPRRRRRRVRPALRPLPAVDLPVPLLPHPIRRRGRGPHVGDVLPRPAQHGVLPLAGQGLRRLADDDRPQPRHRPLQGRPHPPRDDHRGHGPARRRDGRSRRPPYSPA